MRKLTIVLVIESITKKTCIKDVLIEMMQAVGIGTIEADLVSARRIALRAALDTGQICFSLESKNDVSWASVLVVPWSGDPADSIEFQFSDAVSMVILPNWTVQTPPMQRAATLLLAIKAGDVPEGVAETPLSAVHQEQGLKLLHTIGHARKMVDARPPPPLRLVKGAA